MAIDAGGFARAKGLAFVSPDSRSSRPGPLQLLTDCQSRYGDYVAVESDTEQPYYLLSHPDAVEHVLSKAQEKYVKPNEFISRMTSLVGDGLLTSDGEEWLKQRRLIQPAFDPTEIERMSQVVTSCVWHLMRGWDKLIDHEVDLYKELVLLTETIAVELMFGSDQDPESRKLKKALIETLYLLKHFQHEYRMTAVEGDLTQRRLQAANQKFNKLVLQLVDRRKKLRSGEDRDFLWYVLGGNENDVALPEDKHILDQARTLLIVGHSNVASAVAWAFHMLARHQAVRERVLTELSALSGPIGFSTLNSIPYMMQVVDEVVRLYPPTFAVVRELIEDDVVEGREISSGSLVMLSQWITHRHPEFWEDPSTFDPERFTPQRSAGRHKYAYFPFGGGGRRCVARNLALIEVLLTLSAIMSEYEISLSSQPVNPFPSFALIPENGLPARVRRRASA